MVPTSTRTHEHTNTRTHEHTSTRAHEHTSTRAHEHTSTQYPTYPAAEKPDHTRQHLPCRSTEIRHQHTPRCASLPRRPATQAPTVSSIIPAARTEARRTRHAAAQKTPRHEPARPNRRPLHPKNPMSPPFHRGRLHFEQALGGFATIDPSTGTRRWPFQATTGGFATIDPRHAGDTPQRSAYGSNSPQATNENKPHHHDQHTKTCRTRPTQPPKGHAMLAVPSKHSGGFATIDPRHAGDTPQGSAYGSNSPHRAQARPARVGT